MNLPIKTLEDLTADLKYYFDSHDEYGVRLTFRHLFKFLNSNAGLLVNSVNSGDRYIAIRINLQAFSSPLIISRGDKLGSYLVSFGSKDSLCSSSAEAYSFVAPYFNASTA